jgi:hypothetical protein
VSKNKLSNPSPPTLLTALLQSACSTDGKISEIFLKICVHPNSPGENGEGYDTQKDLHSRTGMDEAKRKTQMDGALMERRSTRWFKYDRD